MKERKKKDTKKKKKTKTKKIKVGHHKIVKAFSSFRLDRFFVFFCFFFERNFIVNPFIIGFGASPFFINITHGGSVTDRDSLENWSHGMLL